MAPNEGQARAALRNESGKASFVEIVEFEGAKKVHPQINELRRREARKELARLANWHRDGGGSKSIAGGGADKDHGLKQRDRRPSRSLPHQEVRRRRTRRPRVQQQKTDIAPHAVSAMEALQSAYRI